MPGPATGRSDRRVGPDLFRLRKELTYGSVRGIVVDQPDGRECMGEMGCVSRLSQLLDSLPGVDHGEFVTASRLIRFVRSAQGAVAVDVVPGSDLAADLDTVLPLPAVPTGTQRQEVVR